MKKEMGQFVTGSHKESKLGRTGTQPEIDCDSSRIFGWLPLIYAFGNLLATVFLLQLSLFGMALHVAANNRMPDVFFPLLPETQ